MMERTVEEYTAGDFVEDWDVDGLLAADRARSSRRATSSVDRPTAVDREELTAALAGGDARTVRPREEELGEELMRALERFLLLQIIDQRWREHLHDMDYLREGIHLRGFAQIDPLVAYKNEAFTLFEDLMNIIWADFARMIFHVEVTVAGRRRRTAAAAARSAPEPGGELLDRRGRRQLLRRRRRRSGARRWPRPPAAQLRPAAGPTEATRSADAAAGRRAAPRRRRRAARPQRPLLVRVGQEVQEVSRRLSRLRAAGAPAA